MVDENKVNVTPTYSFSYRLSNSELPQDIFLPFTLIDGPLLHVQSYFCFLVFVSLSFSYLILILYLDI